MAIKRFRSTVSATVDGSAAANAIHVASGSASGEVDESGADPTLIASLSDTAAVVADAVAQAIRVQISAGSETVDVVATVAQALRQRNVTDTATVIATAIAVADKIEGMSGQGVVRVTVDAIGHRVEIVGPGTGSVLVLAGGPAGVLVPATGSGATNVSGSGPGAIIGRGAGQGTATVDATAAALRQGLGIGTGAVTVGSTGFSEAIDSPDATGRIIVTASVIASAILAGLATGQAIASGTGSSTRALGSPGSGATSVSATATGTKVKLGSATGSAVASATPAVPNYIVTASNDANPGKAVVDGVGRIIESVLRKSGGPACLHMPAILVNGTWLPAFHARDVGALPTAGTIPNCDCCCQGDQGCPRCTDFCTPQPVLNVQLDTDFETVTGTMIARTCFLSFGIVKCGGFFPAQQYIWSTEEPLRITVRTLGGAPTVQVLTHVNLLAIVLWRFPDCLNLWGMWGRVLLAPAGVSDQPGNQECIQGGDACDPVVATTIRWGRGGTVLNPVLIDDIDVSIAA